MGSVFELIVHRDDAHLTARAEARLHELERRWSRFRPDSELSRLNRHAGHPVIVSDDTFAVIAAAIDGATATAGRFDPTVHDAMVALGYDRDHTELDRAADRQPGGRSRPTEPMASPAGAAPGVDGIELDDVLRAVTLPDGVALDLGGIGKGTAADLVSGALLADGARGAAVAVGGDVRVRGESPSGGGWQLGGHGADADLPALADGGVCTSSVTRRRWQTDNGDVHHLLDPRTGAPVTSAIETVTVIGATAQQAEILSKAAMVAGADAPRLLADHGVTAVITWQGDHGPEDPISS